MKISDEVKTKIEEEFKKFEEIQYGGKDKKERQKLGQFFTPPVLTIQMLEKFELITNKTILDPTCGAGGLLAAAVIAGADPTKVYGIELDPVVLDIAKKRLLKLGVPPENLKQGDALDPKSYEFEETKTTGTFVALVKNENDVDVSIVKDKKLLKELVVNNKETLKNLLSKLLEKKMKVYKL